MVVSASASASTVDALGSLAAGMDNRSESSSHAAILGPQGGPVGGSGVETTVVVVVLPLCLRCVSLCVAVCALCFGVAVHPWAVVSKMSLTEGREQRAAKSLVT